jgi:hypothetical protein
MDYDVRHLTGLIVIGSGAVVLGLSYFAVYLMGKNAAHKEMSRRDPIDSGRHPDRLDRIERAVDSIAVEVERVAEGQRFLLGNRGAERVPEPMVIKPERRHATPV